MSTEDNQKQETKVISKEEILSNLQKTSDEILNAETIDNISKENIVSKGKGIKKKRNLSQKKNIGCLGWILRAITTLFAIGVLAVAIIVLPIILDTPKVTPEDVALRIEESSLILDANGNVIDKLQGDEFRTIVPLDQISPWLQQAVIAIEDERFYQHNGVDIQRLAGALIYDIKTKSLAQGASTINMQLAKNLYTSTDKSFTRKIKDMYLALKIDSALTKEEILHAYLSTASLSRGNLGAEAASIAFFNKNASQLDLAESAMIAGITKYPSRYTPYITEDITPEDDLNTIQISYIPSSTETEPPTEFDQQLYKTLYETGKIDIYQYDQLKNGHLYTKKAVLNPAAKERQELVLSMMLKNKMIDEATYEAAKAQPIVLNLGQKNTIDISSYFSDALKVQLQEVLEAQGYTPEEAADLMINGGLRIYSTLDSNMQNIVEREIEDSSNYYREFIDENGVIQPQAAFVLIEQETGFVKAMVGGRGIGGSKIFNRALNPRQPGSSIKPLAVYMPALENNMTAATTVKDGKRPDPSHKDGYWPKNSTGYKGISTMSPMIWNSSNVSAVEFLDEVGIKVAIESLKEQGFSTIVTAEDNRFVNDENLSLSLGGMTKGVTPLDITSAFATIANQGEKMTPFYFSKIEDRNGNVLFATPSTGEQIFSPGNSYIMTEMLRKVVTMGTGRSTQIPNMPVVGKTGTTTDEKDIWFVGYTPYYTAGVWVGIDMPTQLYDYARMSNNIWRKVMADVHKDLEKKEFEKPDNVVAVTMCKISGDLPRSSCPRVTDYFVNGTEPNKRCSSHSGSKALGSKNYAKGPAIEKEVVVKEEEVAIPETPTKEVDDLLGNNGSIYIPGTGEIPIPDDGRITIPTTPETTPTPTPTPSPTPTPTPDTNTGEPLDDLLG